MLIQIDNKLEKGTQVLGESLQEFSTAIEEFTYVFLAAHEIHVRRGPGKAFGKDKRE
jgi:hypothetical protein